MGDLKVLSDREYVRRAVQRHILKDEELTNDIVLDDLIFDLLCYKQEDPSDDLNEWLTDIAKSAPIALSLIHI